MNAEETIRTFHHEKSSALMFDVHVYVLSYQRSCNSYLSLLGRDNDKRHVHSRVRVRMLEQIEE